MSINGEIMLLEDGIIVSNSFGIIQRLGIDDKGRSVFALYNREDDREVGRTTDLRVVREWIKK